MKKITELKRVIITTVVVVFAYFSIDHIVNIFVLNQFAKKTTKYMESRQNNTIEYKKEINFLRSKISITDLHIATENATTVIDKIELKKNSGFIIPSKISAFIKNIKTIANGKEYSFVYTDYKTGHKNDDADIELILKVNVFSKQKFGGVKMLRSIDAKIIEDDKSIGSFQVDNFDLSFNDNANSICYSGAIVSNNADIVPYLIKANNTFKWNVKISDNKQFKEIDMQNETDITNNMQIEKLNLNFGFAEVDAKGKISYDNEIKNADIQIAIKNDKDLLNAVFKMIQKTRGDKKIFKQMHKVMATEIVPLLREGNTSSTQNDLILDIKKIDLIPEIIVNGIGATELTNRLISLSND